MPSKATSDVLTKAWRQHITDVILRDAHQSLIATRMRTEDMLPICDKLDAIEATKVEVKHTQGTICYTQSPVHDVDGFVGVDSGEAFPGT
jgi:pyruvate/oxaloacetate carboxyltransferase